MLLVGVRVGFSQPGDLGPLRGDPGDFAHCQNRPCTSYPRGSEVIFCDMATSWLQFSQNESPYSSGSRGRRGVKGFRTYTFCSQVYVLNISSHSPTQVTSETADTSGFQEWVICIALKSSPVGWTSSMVYKRDRDRQT